MGNNKGKRIVITKRDREILVALFENKVMTIEQVHKMFFKGVSRTRVSARLLKLTNYNYLDKRPLIEQNRIGLAYKANENSCKEIGTSYPYVISSSGYRSDSILHDIDLVDIKTVIQNMKMVERYFTESILQSCKEFTKLKTLRNFVSLNSDVAVELNTKFGNFLVALEYEKTIKSPKRYEAKLLDYYLTKGVDAIFYICENSQILNLIGKIDEKLSSEFKPKIYLILMEKVMNHNKEITFSKFNGDTFTLK